MYHVKISNIHGLLFYIRSKPQHPNKDINNLVSKMKGQV